MGSQRRESMAINASKAASGRANTDTVDQDMRQTAGCETKEKVIKTAGKGRGWARGVTGTGAVRSSGLPVALRSELPRLSPPGPRPHRHRAPVRRPQPESREGLSPLTRQVYLETRSDQLIRVLIHHTHIELHSFRVRSL